MFKEFYNLQDYFTPTHKLLYYGLVIIPRLLRLIVTKFSHYIKSDETYIKIIYFLTFGKWLDLNHPEKLKTFTEKTQWLKLHYDKPLHTKMVDKFEMRSIIQEKLGDGYTFPLLGVWNNFDEINFSLLPDQFVLKCTHDSGSVVFCKDKNKFDISAARKKLTKAIKENFYWVGRELPYKNVQPRIIAEPLMTDNQEKSDLKDYKFFCFNGKVKLIQVDYDRFRNHHKNFYSPDWQLLNVFIRYPNDPLHIIPPPKVLPKMLEIAHNLSNGFPFVRIDLYVIDDKIFFGEFTFYHGGGLTRIRPRKFDETMGSWIKLPI